MAIGTYSELKQAVSDWLERSDLTDHVDTFIDLAEARIWNEVRIREMEKRADLSIAEDDRFVDVPTDLHDLKYFRIKVPTTEAGAYYFTLQEITPDEMTVRSIKEQKPPHAFVVWDEQIELDCKADQAYTGELLYWIKLDALSDDNTSNALLTRSPGIYLFASLAEAAPFLMDDPRIPVWENKYESLKAALNRQEREYKRGGPLTVRLQHGVVR